MSSREFKPIVPSNIKGKATFSISLNRVNRVKATTSGTPVTSSNANIGGYIVYSISHDLLYSVYCSIM